MSNNHKIAKNTLLLYVRMFILMAIGLYTSRVVLDVLGVSDYGVYNVVAGFVPMLGYLSTVFVCVTNRFISFSIGKGNKEDIAKVFCTAVSVH